jgi:O-antigen/teichoic acid export membrane protein
MTVYRQVVKHSLLARLSLNSFWLLAARVLSQALAVLFTLAVARALGEAEFGRFAFISTVVFIGNVFSSYGLDTMIIRETALARGAGDERIRHTIHAALMLQLLLSLLYICVVWSLGSRLSADGAAATAPLRVAILSLVPLAFSTIFSAVLRGYERMAAYMWFTVITAAAAGLGATILFWRAGSLFGAAWILLVAQACGAGTAYALYRRNVPPLQLRRLRPDRERMAGALRGGAMLAALMVLAVMYQRLGVIMLALLDSDTATGLYSAAARVLEVLKILPGAVFGALLPMMAAERRPDVRRSYHQTVVFLLGIGVVVAGLTVLLARPLILLLFGAGYEAAVTPLRLMAASLPLTVLAFALSFNLVVARRERAAALSTFLTLIAAAAIIGGMIGRWSLIGAAAALPLCEAIQVALLAWLTLRERRPLRQPDPTAP